MMAPVLKGTTFTSTFPYDGETYTFTVESYLCDKDS